MSAKRNLEPTLYIIEHYDENDENIGRICLPIHSTNIKELDKYKNNNYDIFLGRHNKRTGIAFYLEPYCYSGEMLDKNL